MLTWRPLSVPITETMAVYKNRAEKRPVIEATRDFIRHGMHESTLHLPLHTGTHVDYPLHALAGGKCSSDYLLFPLNFTAHVVDVSGENAEIIGMDQLRGIRFEGIDAVFFKTRTAPLAEFDPLFPWVDGEAAAWLARQNLLFVGIDQPGIERNQPGHETHIALLSRDILIIEGLDLSTVAQGRHRLLALTLGIREAEAEPVLVYLLESSPAAGSADPVPAPPLVR